MDPFDWRILSVAAMLALGVYNVAFKKFFSDGGDWRIFLPIVALAGLAAIAYLAFTYKDMQVGRADLPLIGIILASILIGGVATMLVYADRSSHMTVAVPILALASVVAVLLSIAFLGETLSVTRAAGVLLAVVAIVLVSVG